MTYICLVFLIVNLLCHVWLEVYAACPFEEIGYQLSEVSDIQDLEEFNKRIASLLISRQLYPEAVLCYEWIMKQLNRDKFKEYAHLAGTVKNNIHVLREFMPTVKTQLFEAEKRRRDDVFDSIVAPLKWQPESQNQITAAFGYLLNSTCPFHLERADPIAVSNAATEKLIPEGRILAALNCFKWAYKTIKAASKNQRDLIGSLENLRLNIEAIDNLLNALPSHHIRRRIIHVSNGTKYPSELEPVRPRKNNFITYWDGALDEGQCAAIISLFESSKLYEGNIIRDGKVVVDLNGKKNSEFDITGTIDSKPWAAVEIALLSLTTKYLMKYESLNPVVYSLPSPLGDEGFRMKRYKNDGTEHHSYHIDSGSELTCKPRRVLAMILYLNEVSVGGETVFLNQGKKIKPKCGRLALFPTDYTVIHAGRRPVSNTKYNIINFLTY